MRDNVGKKLIVTFFIIFITMIYMLTSVGIYLYIRSFKYNNKVYPNTFLNKNEISGYSYQKLEKELEKHEYNKNVTLMYNDQKIETNYKELGIFIDSKKTVNSIKQQQKNISIPNKMWILMDAKKNNVNYEFKVDEEHFRKYMEGIKEKYDSGEISEKFERDDNMNIKYVPGTSSHYLDVDKTIENIKIKGLKDEKTINLVVNNGSVTNHKEYESIDTKVSSFSTEFNPYISRATNLRTALNYIDGAIIEPGEVFSFYKYAGPYNKRGYVFYYEFVGNGVCQIATTTYNAALLGGLEIKQMYQHEYMVPYVVGGLDATVASYSGGYYVDMSFKNTYKYPIYISAYYIGGKAYVDFWSNSNAKEGKTYETESVKIGPTSYAAYLKTYKDGQLLERKHLSNSWYKIKQD